MTTKSLHAALALCLLCGCAAAAPKPAFPQRQVYEVLGTRVHLVTDLEPGAAAELGAHLDHSVAALERHYQELSGLAPRPLSAPIEILAFDAFDPTARTAGVTISDDLGPVLVARAPAKDSLHSARLMSLRRTAVHELSHLLATASFGALPNWLAEGLAVYQGALEFGPDGRQVWMGADDPRRRVGLDATPPVIPSVLLGWKLKLTEPLARNYASSWHFVRYLVRERPAVLRELLQRIARGTPPKLAIAEVIPEQDHEALDYALSNYPISQPAVSTFAVEPGPAPTVHPLGPGEWAAMNGEAWLRRNAGGRDGHAWRKRAQWLLSCALAQEPGNRRALLLEARLAADPARRVAALRELVEAHPDHATGWALLLREAQAGNTGASDRRRAFEAVSARHGDNPLALEVLARELVASGRTLEGLALAQRAVSVDPVSALNHESEAVALESLDRCPEALEAQRRAAARTYGRHAKREAILKEFARLHQRCGPPQEPPSSGPSAPEEGQLEHEQE